MNGTREPRDFTNAYADADYATAYATLEFAGTYHLAYRDIPEILRTHARGQRALDFGSGAGRSTRFLRALGFEAVGVDISAGMIERAREMDPQGDYRRVGEGDLGILEDDAFDVGLAAFTFDNIPTRALKVRALAELRRVLGPEGRLVLIVSSPEIYTHEWVSFTTRDFPENWTAGPGDVVKTRIVGIGDSRPVEDVLWPDASYREVFRESGLDVEAMHAPLATGEEPYPWVSETTVAPWVIYVLRRSRGGPGVRT